jgi:DNA-binding NarL/FixJ family response regulator
MTLRVVLAEDSLIAREGIIRVLENVDDIEIVATCSDAVTLQAAIERTRPHVVLTDIRMPPGETDEGIRIAEALRTSHPEIGVVVLSQYAEPVYAVALFAAGSDRRAYLLKERLKDRGELARAIREVASGGSVVDPRVVETLLAEGAGKELASLTLRELEILALIAQGHSNGAIADALVITKRGVEHHINQIFFKLELGDEKDVNRRVMATILYLAGPAG